MSRRDEGCMRDGSPTVSTIYSASMKGRDAEVANVREKTDDQIYMKVG